MAANRTSGVSINDILPSGKYFSDPSNTGAAVIAAASTSFTLAQTHSNASERHLATSYGSIASSYNFNYFKNKYASRDTTPGSNVNPINLGSLTGKSYYYYSGSVTVNGGTFNGNAVIITDGSLTINGNINLAANSSLAFFAGGDINVNGSVDFIKGFFMAGVSGRFDSGASNNQLKVTGGVVADHFSLGRTLASNSQPAEIFVSDPSIFINLNPVLGERRYTWYEVAD